MGSNQAKNDNARGKTTWNNHVEWAGPVGDEVGDDAACDRSRVENGEKIEAEIGVRDSCRDGEVLDVEEGHVEAHESDQSSKYKEDVCGFCEGHPIDELSLFCGYYSYLEHRKWNSKGGEDHEANDPRCPSKSDLRL